MTTTPPSPAAPDYDAAPLRPRPGKAARIIGWILSVLPALGLLLGAAMMLSHNEKAMEDFHRRGFPDQAATYIGITAAACAVLYLLPPTAVLGAILVTGYLGGAVVTHVLGHESFAAPIIVGVVVWLGLFLRDPRLRALIPFRH
jgi:hypothetical protein